MFELLGGGLLGSIFGGLFRLAPEVLKWLDKPEQPMRVTVQGDKVTVSKGDDVVTTARE